jgi:hypothetical protein
MIEYGNLFPELMQKIVGTNETLFGQDQGGNSQISGRLAEVRTANGLRANRSIFDNFEQAQKLLGNLVLSAIQINYSPQKVQRITNEEPTQEFFDAQFGKYDAVTKNSILSQSQKDTFYSELKELLGIYGEDKIPFNIILDAMPMVGKSTLMEELKKHNEAQQQQAQQQAQVQAEDKARAVSLQDAEREQKIALAQERRARVVSDIALGQERSSEAIQNRAQASLDRAKTLSELQDVSDDRLIKVIKLLREIEAQDNVDRQQVVDSVQDQAQAILESDNRNSGLDGLQAQAGLAQQQEPNFEGGL